MSTAARSRWQSPLLPALALPLVVVPACVLLHELGHGAAMLALGFTDVGPLSASSIGQGVPPPDLPEWGSALVMASGPTVTLLASAVGLALAAAARWVPLSLSLLFAPTVEPVVDPLLGPEGAEFAGWAGVVGWEGGATAFVVLGVSLVLALLAAGVWLLLRRGVPHVWPQLLAVVLGTICAEAVWFVFGPALLP